MMGAESTSCSKDCSEPMEPDTIQPMELVVSVDSIFTSLWFYGSVNDS